MKDPRIVKLTVVKTTAGMIKSSSIYKVIRPVLNFLFFFYDKISLALKAQSIYWFFSG